MLDRIRDLYPHLAIGVYALEPGGALTVEVFAPDGTRFAKTARTEVEALTAIFGPLPDDEPQMSSNEKDQPNVEPPAVNPFD